MTTTPTPIEILDEAIKQVDHLRHPDVKEAQSLIHKVLAAAEIGTIEHDDIDRLYWSSLPGEGPVLCVQTTWYARGCQSTSDYTIPRSVFEHENPELAARAWGSGERYGRANDRVRAAANELIDARNHQAKAKKAHIEALAALEPTEKSTTT